MENISSIYDTTVNIFERAEMKVRILKVHEKDAYYEDRDKIEGMVFTINDELQPRIQHSDGTCSIHVKARSDGDYSCFYKVMIEEIEDKLTINPGDAIEALGQLATFMNKMFPTAKIMVDGEVRNATENIDMLRQFILEQMEEK